MDSLYACDLVEAVWERRAALAASSPAARFGARALEEALVAEGRARGAPSCFHLFLLAEDRGRPVEIPAGWVRTEPLALAIEAVLAEAGQRCRHHIGVRR